MSLKERPPIGSRQLQTAVGPVLAAVAAAALLVGCAQGPRGYRTPLTVVTVPVSLRDLRIGLLDVMVVPTEVEAERTALVAFPDEVMFVRPASAVVDDHARAPVDRGGVQSSPLNLADQRIMVSNPVGLGITETMVLALRDAGLRADPYKTRAAATDAGVDLLLAGVVRDRRVVFADAPSWHPHLGLLPILDASAELVVTALDVRSARMWTRSLTTRVRIEPVLGPTDDGRANALLPVGEAHAQSARSALTQVYYNLAMELVRGLQTGLTIP